MNRLCIGLFTAALAMAQTPAGKPAASAPVSANTSFVLNDVENKTAENLRLKKNLLQSQATLLQIQIQQATEQLNKEIKDFGETTIKSHGSPVNIAFDPVAVGFEVKSEKTAAAK